MCDDRYEFKVGDFVKPHVGFWSRLAGEVISVDVDSDKPYKVYFEENEMNYYCEDELSAATNPHWE